MLRMKHLNHFLFVDGEQGRGRETNSRRDGNRLRRQTLLHSFIDRDVRKHVDIHRNIQKGYSHGNTSVVIPFQLKTERCSTCGLMARSVPYLPWRIRAALVASRISIDMDQDH